MYQFVIRLLLVVLLAVTVTGAADTKLSTTWRDPGVTTTNFSKIVMAFITSDADLRRRIEDGLVRRTQRSVAAYTLRAGRREAGPEALKAHLAKNGVDAAIVVRLVELEKDMVISTGESWNVGLPTLLGYVGYVGHRHDDQHGDLRTASIRSLQLTSSFTRWPQGSRFGQAG